MPLEGARVLVTGASRGIGRELARAFAAAGSVPVLVARDASALERVAAETGGVALPADLGVPGEVATLWQRAEELAGPVQVLVNNAGVGEAGDLADTDWAAVERMVQVNLLAPVRLCQDAVRALAAQRRPGHLVNVSSLAAAAVTPGLAGYSATKAALSHFTAGLRAELAGSPVGTTLVEIGPTVTAMLDGVEGHPPTARSFARMRRLGLLVDLRPELVAAAVVQAVRAGRPSVRLPRRAAGLALLPHAGRAVSLAVLAGVPRRAAGPGSRR